jgi:hypothetical protein
MAKELKIIDTNVFSGSRETFRTAVGGYWETLSASAGEQVDPIYYYNSEDSAVDDPYNPFLSLVHQNTDLQETLSEDVIIPNYRFPLRVVGNPDNVKSDDHWKTIFLGGTFGDVNYDGIYTNATFDNYSFDYELPYPKQESKYILDSSDLDSVIQITCEYNHHLPKYEEYIKRLDSELLIPNIYLLKMYEEYPGSADEELGIEIPTFVENFVTLEGTYETATSLLEPVEDEIDTEGNIINMEDSLIYQYLTSSIVITSLSASTTAHIKNRFQNLLFDNNFIESDTYVDMSESTDMVPFYIKFNFNAEHLTYDADGDLITDKIGHSLGNNNSANKWLKTLKEIFTNQITLTPEEQEVVVQTSYFSGSTDLTTNTYKIDGTTKSYKSIDYMDMLLYMYKNYISTTDDCYFMGANRKIRQATMDTSGSSRYYNSINVIQTINETIEYISSTSNFSITSLEDLYHLTPSYHETLAYRIEKIGGPPAGDSQTQNVLQNFWFSNTDAFMDETTEFYDTQVKYGQDYTYNVYAYALVIGAKYNFSDLTLSRQIGSIDAEDYSDTPYCTEFYNPDSGEASVQLFDSESNLETQEANQFATNAQVMSANKHLADFYLNYEPSIKIIEIPIASKTLKVMDSPPNQLNVIPYQMMDASQRIGYTLYYEIFNNTATYPTSITSNDAKMKSDYLHAKDLLGTDYLDEESISKQRYIQVYRLDEKPTAMTDFQNNLIATIDLKNTKTLSTKSVQDFIQKVRTNTQYYYVFRALNEQYVPGHMTEIYEAQLINDGGYIYSIFNVLFEEDLEEDVFVNPSKSFKKLFHLTPNLAQLTLRTEDVDYAEPAHTQIGNMGVGDVDDLIWGKQFKIRLTSKKTGKKIDLNFTYNLESD